MQILKDIDRLSDQLANEIKIEKTKRMNEKAVSGNLIGMIIMIPIAIYIMAAIVPGAITALMGANQTSWDSGTKAVWGVLGIIVVVVIVLALLKSTGVV